MYQLVVNKTFHRTDVKLTLRQETQNAEYGKIDSDQGLVFPLGPGRIRCMAFALRQSFSFGSLQATFEQADAARSGLGTGNARGTAADRRSFVDVSKATLPFARERRI
ncbi:MAG: hypothetical protein ACLQU1_42655 [Bryobacteraceae bacterium]